MNSSGAKPPYLTVGDDLQIIPSDNRFLSKSRRSIEAVVGDVEEWIEANPSHARCDEAKQWLDKAHERIFEIGVQRVVQSKRMDRAQTEKIIRRRVHDYLWEQNVSFKDLPGKTEELTKKLLTEFCGSEPE